MRALRVLGSLLLLLAAVLALTALPRVEAADEFDSSVLSVTDANFDQTLAQHPGGLLLMFHAPWCGHCKRLAPDFGTAAAQLQGQVALGQIDCTQNSGLKSRFKIKGFPTLLFFRGANAEPRKYKGARTAQALVDFGRVMSQPPLTELTSANQLTLLQQQALHPVMFLALDPSPQRLAAFEAVAREFQGDFPFLVPADGRVRAELAKSLGLEAQQKAVVRLALGDDPKLAPETADLKTWVSENRLAPLTEMPPSMFAELTGLGKRMLWTVYDSAPEAAPAKARVLQAMRELARADLKQQQPGGQERIHVAVDGQQYSRYLSQFGIAQEQLPAVFVFDFAYESYFPPLYLPAEASTAQLQQLAGDYLQAVVSGNLQPIALTPWWHPSRWLKLLERFLSQFDETTLILGTLGVSVLILGVSLLLCTLLAPKDAASAAAPVRAAAAQAAKASKKRASKRKAD